MPHDFGDYEQGAFAGPGGTTFRVWAPRTPQLALELSGGPRLPMQRRPDGLFEVFAPGVGAGARYAYRFPDGRLRPDPASRLQEGSVHEPSTVVDLAFNWNDASWRGVPLERLAIYELHVGTFTPEGTLDAAIRRLPELVDLGVTAVEVMPVAEFDGARGWGYDGVLLYATHAAYGGPAALQRFVDACHAAGLAAILDVVYNHLGPSGNYLRDFGPYFTDRHATPWGEAINYDGPDAAPVREFVIDNALGWVRDFHFDGLRLDAVHGIVDESKPQILEELNDRVQALAQRMGRQVHVIAESDLNDPKLIRRKQEGGYGLAAQWSDDFHHALHTLVTGERDGYYADFGRLEDFAKAWREGFVMTGQHSEFRGKPHGQSARGLPGRRFVIFAQNHDQVGNRALGGRLSATLPPEALRLCAAATLLSPFIPLVFQGEEYGESAPFQYFTSFPDRELGRAVSEGRRREFAKFTWKGEVPDPQDPATFERSRVDPALARREPHASTRRFYQRALALRAGLLAAAPDAPDAQAVVADPATSTLLVRRPHPKGDLLVVLHLAASPATVSLPDGGWRVELDSWDPSLAAGEARWSLGASPRSGSVELGPWHAALLLKPAS